MSPDGTMVYISHLYECSVSDVDLVQQCGLLSLLESGDSVMADKGFDIQHLLSRLGVRLNIPPFRQDQQFTPDIMKTKKIAAVCIHVERAINRMKQYALVGGVIPNTWDIADQLVFVDTLRNLNLDWLHRNNCMKSKGLFVSLTLYQPVMANASMASHKNLYGGFNTRLCT